MGKKIRFSIGAMAGALLQYLYDPQEGGVRRALLRDQVAERVEEAKTALTKTAMTRGMMGRSLAFGSFRLTPSSTPMGPNFQQRPKFLHRPKFQQRHRIHQRLGLHGLIS